MINPFESLGRKRAEVVDGSFACQHSKCYNVNIEALYDQDKKVLFWDCQDGHENTIEGFEIYG